MDKDILFFSIANYGEFGQRRIRETLNVAEKRRIPFVVPSGSTMCIVKWRFGDIAANTINFRFDSCRNVWEQDILIGTELLNFITEPEPYVIAIGGSGAIVVENIDIVARDFEMVYDFYLINNEIQGRIREFVYAEREIFRGMITKQAGTGGA